MLALSSVRGRVRRLAGRLALAATDLLFPPRCVACGSESAFLCPSCQGRLPHLEPPFCLRCAQPLPVTPRGQAARTWEGGWCSRCQVQPLALEGIRAPYRMEGVAQQAVHALKYRNLRALAPTMGRLLAAFLTTQQVGGELVVPVPLHPKRLRERGYNQAELLARELGRCVALPVAATALQRLRATPPQVSATREERLRNVQGAFRARSSFQGMRVMLVDDVCTTGATLDACAVALREAGASAVWAAVFAREE
ncbi:MAG: ComF family protein [Chloroflexi bacterium]|nr:ComF family protein [Chloroflexota bacterium]